MLVVFTVVRSYTETDLEELVKVYQSAFAEPPWNEYKKCVCCGIEYGKQEALEAVEKCKICKEKLILTEFWSAEDVTSDLNFALSQPSNILLVCGFNSQLFGFTWGYRLPEERFPFLNGRIPSKVSYMDEIAVRGDSRLNGVGYSLGDQYLNTACNQGMNGVVLRTDCRNVASMALFRKLGFQATGITDPQYKNRVYLFAPAGGKNER